MSDFILGFLSVFGIRKYHSGGVFKGAPAQKYPGGPFTDPIPFQATGRTFERKGSAMLPDIVVSYNDPEPEYVATSDAMCAELVKDSTFTAKFLNMLADQISQGNKDAGWWKDIETGEDVRDWPKKYRDLWIGSKLMLIVTEISEAMEGHRKNLPDDKLPHRPMFRVELADALIRILDMAGGLSNVEHPIGDIVQEKRAYNAVRADHKIENRMSTIGGKSI